MNWQWFIDNWGTIAALWLIVEQILADTSLKSNSTFQLVCNIINSVIAVCTPKGKEPAKQTAE
jgi:hypothetical protein